MQRSSGNKPDLTISVELECLQCHTQTSKELSSEEFKELSTAWNLKQECDTCGTLTDWSFAEPRVGSEEQVDFWDWLATTGSSFVPPAPQDDRRKESRVDLRVPLRIATAAGDEEEVKSENISKSGLCFYSSKAYSVGQVVQVTLQAPDPLATQVRTATIVRSSPAQEGRTLYGARLMALV